MIQQKLSSLGLDQRIIQAAEEIIKAGSCAVSKPIRAGFSTSCVYACEGTGLRLIVLAPTRKILTETIAKASEGAIRIPANSECPLIEPDIKKNPILAQLPLNLPDCKECEASEWCEVREIIRVEDFTVAGLTYAKLEALMLSKSPTAAETLEKISRADIVLPDESHLISLPSPVSVRVFASVEIPESYPVLTRIYEAWQEFCRAHADVIQDLMQKAKMGHAGQHLSKLILNQDSLAWNTLKPAYSQLREIAVGHELEDSDILCLRDIITVLSSPQIPLSYLSEQDGESGAVYAAAGVGRMHRALQEFLSKYADQACHIYCSGTQFQPYPGFFSELSGKPIPEVLFPDIRGATQKLTLIPDTWRLTSRNFSEKLPIIIGTIKAISKKEGRPIYLLAPSRKKAGILKEEVKKAGIKDIFVDFYRSDRSIGVARTERAAICIGLAEVPSNAYDALARGKDRWLDSRRLRKQAVDSATWQAANRVRDPEGKVESRIYFIGCRLEQVRQVATWGTNRQVVLREVKEIKGSNGEPIKVPEFEIKVDEPLEMPRIYGEEKDGTHSNRRKVSDFISRIELYNIGLINSENRAISSIHISRENGAKVSFYNLPLNKDEIDITAHALFITFANRTEAYGQQFLTHTTGKWEFSSIKRTLTEELLKKHIMGEIALGSYEIGLDDMVTWCADDFDSHGGADPEIARDNVQKVVAVLRKYSIPFLLESSGSIGGYHIWILLARTSTLNAFKFIRQINAEAKVDTECWPKQKSLDSKDAKYGNLLKIPICYHNGGKGRSAFLDPDTFEPLEGPIAPPGRVHLLEVPDPSKLEGMPKVKISSPKNSVGEGCAEFRPCLKALLESGHALEGGDGHDMRLAIAAEARCSGIPINEAVKLFSYLPDFDEATTRKHLESIYKGKHSRHRCDTLLEKAGSIIAPYCLSCRMPWASENMARHREAKA